MRQLGWLVVSVVLVASLVACGDDDGSASAAEQVNGLAVAATTTIIADLARNVAGERATVIAIIPAGADPHDFEPTPDDVEDLADADLVLEHGLGYDAWAHNLVEQSDTHAFVVEVTDGVTVIDGNGRHEHAEGDAEHGAGEIDPHVWFDIGNIKKMVTNIRDALITVDPDGRAAYETNAAAYLAELDTVDGWIHAQVATIPESDRKLVTSHESFGYYAAAYGFEYVGSIISSLDSQAQPSARQVEQLLDLIEAEGVRAIFTETTVNPDLAETIADELDIKVVTDLYSDSLSDDGSETDNYIGMMRQNTTEIVDALT